MWDANYVGVWHLDESGSGVLDEFVDSSGTGNHGQGGDGDSGKTPALTTNGQIGNAQDFDGTDGTPRHLRVNGALSNGVRYHVAGTWDGTTLRVFLNGVERDSKTPGGSLGAFSGGNISDADPTEAMDGIIDEDRISNIARSPDWIAAQHPR